MVYKYFKGYLKIFNCFYLIFKSIYIGTVILEMLLEKKINANKVDFVLSRLNNLENNVI